MTYLTGTMTDSNAPAAIAALVGGALITEGYQLVDTIVITVNTHKVYKNPAANNPSGLDWYLWVSYTTTGAGNVGWYIAESFNIATHKVIRPGWCSQGSQGPGVAAPQAWHGPTYSPSGLTEYTVDDSTPGYGISQTSNGHRNLLTPTTTHGYWISVTPSRVVGFNSVDPLLVIYSGLYTPTADYTAAVAAGSIFPLVSARLGSTGAGTTPAGACCGTRAGGASQPPGNPGYWYNNWSISSTATNYDSVPPTNRMNNLATSKAGRYQFNWALWTFMPGYLIGVYPVMTSGAVTRGDTVTVDGRPAVLTTSASSQSVCMEAA